MKRKKACLVINPHAGQNVTKIADLIAVLAAAGWSTDIALKEFGGQSMELAARAAKANYDLVIGYGGDGTLNQVLNGVMNAGRCQSIVGVIPGGTANVWAAEIGVPHDPVQAALTLVNSEARKVDIGHVEVQGLSFPGTTQDDREKRREKKGKQIHKREAGATTKAKHHFLLMAGLGFDAAIMEHVSKAFKYRVGRLAPVLSAAEELPRQHPFPVEIRVGGTKHEDEKIWQGEAFQVVVGNTRRYANIVQMTPGAYLDDGLLQVCLITAGNTLKTIEQLATLLFRRRPDNAASEHFEGASITISIPASIDLQLDGSAVRLKDYLHKADRKALQSAGNTQEVMVTYRFDAMPRALQVAIPSTYDGALFEKPVAEEKLCVSLDEKAAEQHGHIEEVLHESEELIAKLLAHGHQVTVRGVTAQPEKQHTYIIAGTVPHQMTGDVTPVALRVDSSVTILRRSGEHASPVMVQELQESAVIVAAGKKSKYGVIRTTHLVI
ncbi:MAG TPA: diacylglycerol kinase family protein [Ktedonobacteraceae bacterium]|nr:diacylglycerol kinase family protein [Ktedonobacteraceae bacterium]